MLFQEFKTLYDPCEMQRELTANHQCCLFSWGFICQLSLSFYVRRLRVIKPEISFRVRNYSLPSLRRSCIGYSLPLRSSVETFFQTTRQNNDLSMRGNYVLNKGQILGSAYCPLHRSLTMAWRLGVFNLPLTLLMRLYRRTCGFSQPMIKFKFIHSYTLYRCLRHLRRIMRLSLY